MEDKKLILCVLFHLCIISFSFPGAFALVSNSIDSESHCMGSLTIAHEDDFRNVNYLNLEGHRTDYPNLKRGFPIVRRNAISHIEIIGNCCWELYEGRKYRGQKQILSPGGNLIYPDFQPVSIKKMECVI